MKYIYLKISSETKKKQFYLCDICVLHMPVGDLPEAGHVVTWTEILPYRE